MKCRMKTAGLIAALVIIVGAAVIISNESNAQEKTYKIGDKGPAGGWIFYDKGSYSDGWRYLEAAPVGQGRAAWGYKNKSIPVTQKTAIGSGKINTQAIIENCGEANIAAKLCTAYRGGGKSDWFLPSKDELNLMCTNLDKLGLAASYWSSSEGNAQLVWVCDFGNCEPQTCEKDDYMHVRAARAF